MRKGTWCTYPAVPATQIHVVLTDYTFCLRDPEYITFTSSFPLPISSSIHYVHFFLDSLFTFFSFHSSLVFPHLVHFFPPCPTTIFLPPPLPPPPENLVLFSSPPLIFFRLYSFFVYLFLSRLVPSCFCIPFSSLFLCLYFAVSSFFLPRSPK